MTKNTWWIYLLLSSAIVLSGLNLLWLKSPGSIHLAVLVFFNLVGGLAFVCSLFRVALLLVRKEQPGTNAAVRPLLSLALSLFLANAVALYICNFHLCSLTILVNIAVPVAWYVGREAMVRRVASRKAS